MKQTNTNTYPTNTAISTSSAAAEPTAIILPSIAACKAAALTGTGLRKDAGKAALFVGYGALVACASAIKENAFSVSEPCAVSLHHAIEALDIVCGRDAGTMDIYDIIISNIRRVKSDVDGKQDYKVSSPSVFRKFVRDYQSVESVKSIAAKAPRLTGDKPIRETKEVIKLRSMTKEERQACIERKLEKIRLDNERLLAMLDSMEEEAV